MIKDRQADWLLYTSKSGIERTYSLGSEYTDRSIAFEKLNMKHSSFRTNILYGLVVIVPMIVVGLILFQFLEIVKTFAEFIGLDSRTGAGVAIVVALFLLLGICYGIGMLVRTRIGAWSFERVEKKLLQHVPGYRITSNILKGFAGTQKSNPPVLARLSAPGVAVFGLVIEENDNDTLTVFVPTAPAMTVGNLHIVSRDRVTYLEADMLDLVNCVTEWGTGSKKLLGTIPIT